MYSKLKSNLRNNLVLYYFLLSGFLIRLIFATFPGFKIDVDSWFAWSLKLQEVGLLNFYQPNYFADYPPGLLYLLYLLANIKFLFNLSNPSFYLLLKLPSILAETLLAYLTYKVVLKKGSKKWAFAALIGILYNPGLIFNSSVWGQGDSILALLLLLLVIFLSAKKYFFSSIMIGFSFLAKPQTIALFPLILLFIIKNRSLQIFLKLFIPAFLAVFLLQLPFFLSNPFLGLVQLLTNTANQYPHTSLFAYNLWGIIGFWISDSTKFSIFSYQLISTLIFLLYWIFLAIIYLRQGKPNIFLFSSLALLGFFFLPTRVHERYLYTAIPFLFITTAQYKSKILYIFVTVLSLVYLSNLYFVYVYYNEFYLKLPKVLYIPNFYELLETQGKVMSIISTLLFLIITITILRIITTRKHDH